MDRIRIAKRLVLIARALVSGEIYPNDGRKSFYGKAIVEDDGKGGKVLYSYGTPVMSRDSSGTYHRLWHGWSSTTGRHIRAWSGMNKGEYLDLPLERLSEVSSSAPVSIDGPYDRNGGSVKVTPHSYYLNNSDGSKVLVSYKTKVLKIDSNGKYHRLWNDFSVTTWKQILKWSRMMVEDGVADHLITINEWKFLPVEEA